MGDGNQNATIAEVKVIVNEMVASRLANLEAALNRIKGGLWTVGAILTVLKIADMLGLHK